MRRVHPFQLIAFALISPVILQAEGGTDRSLYQFTDKEGKRVEARILSLSGDRRFVKIEREDDQTFDLVVSIFGAMFAPRPFDVAKEIVRVTRPGGRIVMGNWIPGDPTLVAQILKISTAYSPPPPEGFVSPMTWGIEDDVVERFVAAGVPEANISFARDTFVLSAPVSPSDYLAQFKTYYGPTMNAFEAAEANGRGDDLLRELDALFNEQNQSPNNDTTSIPATYLRVTAEV